VAAGHLARLRCHGDRQYGGAGNKCFPHGNLQETLYDKLNFNFIRDVAPVAGIHRELNVMKVTV
jgi:hypothetical protein